MVIVVRSCCCNCWFWCRFCNLKIVFWWSLITSCLLDYDLTERAPDRAWRWALGALSNCLNPCHNTKAVIAIFIVILTTRRWGQTIAVANFLRMPIVQTLGKIDMFVSIDQNYSKLLPLGDKNIARIVKAALHVLPGKSCLDVCLSCLSCLSITLNIESSVSEWMNYLGR